MKIQINTEKNIVMLSFVIVFCSLFKSCVAPPDYSDGLLENLPAVVNEEDFFSLSIFGNDFNDSLEWELEMSLLESDILLTTFVIKDLNILSSDSSSLIMTMDLGDTIFNAIILNDMVFTSKDSIKLIGIPKNISLYGDNFTGRLEYQLIKNPSL